MNPDSARTIFSIDSMAIEDMIIITHSITAQNITTHVVQQAPHSFPPSSVWSITGNTETTINEARYTHHINNTTRT